MTTEDIFMIIGCGFGLLIAVPLTWILVFKVVIPNIALYSGKMVKQFKKGMES